MTMDGMQRTGSRMLGLIAAGVLVTGLGGCSNDDDPVAAPSTSAPPSRTTPSASPTPSLTASPPPTPATPATPTPTPTPSPTSTPSASPSIATPTKAPPSPVASSSAPAFPKGGTLRSVRRDVSSIAPQLESYYQQREYPVDLAQVRQTLAESGVTLSPGNSIGAYVYDGDAVEFVLCVENTSGAWATYDTAPMTLARSGGRGGCAAS